MNSRSQKKKDYKLKESLLSTVSKKEDQIELDWTLIKVKYRRFTTKVYQESIHYKKAVIG